MQSTFESAQFERRHWWRGQGSTRSSSDGPGGAARAPRAGRVRVTAKTAAADNSSPTPYAAMALS